MSKPKCPDCESQEIITTNVGEIICKKCGLVIDDLVIDSNIPLSSKPSMPYLATAGSVGKEGKIFKNHWLLTTREKNTQKGMTRIDEVTNKLSLPQQISREAKIIFKQSVNKDLCVGRDQPSIILASIYIACSMHGLPKTPNEITLNTEIDTVQLMKATRLIRKKLDLRMPVMDPLDLLPRFANKLDLVQTTQTLATEMIMKIKESTIISGRRPETIVAAALYLSAKQNNEHITQRQISNATGIIEVTIRKRTKEIQNVLKFN